MIKTYGSLFSGIGGLDLGFERATGARCSFQVEADSFCRGILAKHWPDASRFSDVRTATGRTLPDVDAIVGGFPCQNVSLAGRGGGLDGEQSGLWREFARIVDEKRPRALLVENVPALTSRGLDRVVRDLARLGYVGSWDVVSAASVGAPHLRRRIFLVAALAPDADSVALRLVAEREPWRRARDIQRSRQALPRDDGSSRAAPPHADVQHLDVAAGPERQHVSDAARARLGSASPDADESPGQPRRRKRRAKEAAEAPPDTTGKRRRRRGAHDTAPGCGGGERCEEPHAPALADVEGFGPWGAAPWWGDGWIPRSAIRRMDDGLPGILDGSVPGERFPHDVDRCRALGNAVVPQAAEVAALALLEVLAALEEAKRGSG